MSYEYYDVIYSDKGEYKSFECEAESPEDAEDQLVAFLKGRRMKKQYEVIEIIPLGIIPLGIIGDCEVTLFDRQILEL